MESKTTSKTSCLKALLLKAWRERWTDLQWAINIKTVLPRGVSGDVYNLADCILQQAIVGSGANQLVLSYLKHSLSAQLVSHAAVLQSLSKYSQLQKTHCVFSLLEFLEGMLSGITCSGKPEETVLACALLSTAGWLVQVLQQCRSTASLIEKAEYLLQTILKDDFYLCMICLARYIDTDLFLELDTRCSELYASLPENDPILDSLRFLKTLDVSVLPLPLNADTWPGTLVQYWLAIKLIKSPSSPTSALSEELRLFQTLKGYNNTRLYAELLRGSLLSLHDVSQTTHEGQWGAFAFLKVPNILSELVDKNDFNSVANAIELLLQHIPLLEMMDATSSCSTLESLLEELGKARLISNEQIQLLMSRRGSPTCLKLDSPPTNAGIRNVVTCAESTLARILKTLSSDDHKVQVM